MKIFCWIKYLILTSLNIWRSFAPWRQQKTALSQLKGATVVKVPWLLSVGVCCYSFVYLCLLNDFYLHEPLVTQQMIAPEWVTVIGTVGAAV